MKRDRRLQGRSSNFTDEGLQTLIQSYTREAGVRNLEREIGNVCRKSRARSGGERDPRSDEKGTRGIERSAGQERTINEANWCTELLGPRKFRDLEARQARTKSARPPGLAWTEVGGSDSHHRSCTLMEGRGKLHHHR